MEFNDRTSRPFSNREMLYQQVEEQSNVCDVTIQVGQWSKRFHWCVLVLSPFFECIRRSDFLERKTELVKLDFATPVTAEAAILFLYGKRPRLTEENVTAILEMSEFLLMPNLKSKCVAFLRHIPITEENCMRMLEISSFYDFEFTQCYDYIRGNLPEILRKDEAMMLTKESVLILLTDPVLSYWLAEEKFDFVIRWVNASKKNRDAFAEMFKAIDKESVDEEFLKTVILQHPLVTEMGIAIPELHVRGPQRDHWAIMFPKLWKNNKIVCFDIDSGRWSGIDVGLHVASSFGAQVNDAPVIGTRKSREVYRIANRQGSFIIYLQDLDLNQCTITTVSDHENKRLLMGERFQSYGISRDTFIACTNESRLIHRSTEQGEISVGRQSCVDIAILYCGQLQQQDTNTVICPIFTIRNAYIESVCVNEQNLIALLSSTKSSLYIYDMSNGQLDTVALSTQVDLSKYRGPQIAAKDGGFILYNQKNVLDISRLNCQDVTKRYAVRQVQLKNDPDCPQLFIYSKKIWFHIMRRKGKGKLEVSCVNHESLMTVSPDEVAWNQLSSPPEGTCIHLSGTDDAFMVELPKSILRCHFDCPHCSQRRKKLQQCQNQRMKSLSLAKTEDYFYPDVDDDLSEDHHYHYDYYDDHRENDDCYGCNYDDDDYYYYSD